MSRQNRKEKILDRSEAMKKQRITQIEDDDQLVGLETIEGISTYYEEAWQNC